MNNNKKKNNINNENMKQYEYIRYFDNSVNNNK